MTGKTASKILLGFILAIVLVLPVVLADISINKYGDPEFVPTDISINKYGAPVVPDTSNDITISKYAVEVVPTTSEDILINKYSVSSDFFASAQFINPNVCSCGSFVDRITIVNTGSFGAIFSVNTNLPDYVKIPFNQATLEPGESTTVDLFIDAPCGAVNDFNYDVFISNNLNKEKVISRILSFNECQNLQASLYVDKESILPCEPVNYTARISNPSTFVDTYILEPLTFENYFNAEKYELIIGPGDVGVVNAELGLDCSIYGTQEIDFRISSLKNGLSAYLYHDLQVVQDYQFTIASPDEINACEDISNSFELELTNNARFENSYHLSLEGNPDFVSLDKESMIVSGDSKEKFSIVASPAQKEIGTYSFLVKIESDLGDQVFEKNITLKVNDCFNVFVELESQENPNLCEGSHTFVAKVRNDGLLEENIHLVIDSDGISSSLSKNLVSLKPGEEESVAITMYVPGELDGKKIPVALKASVDETLEYWSDTIEPEASSPYFCTYATPEKTKLYSYFSDDKVFLGLKNRGVMNTVYDIKYEGDDKISFDKRAVSVKAGETEFLRINTDYASNDSNTHYYKVSFTSKDTDVKYDYDFKIVRTSGPITDKILSYINTSTCTRASSLLVLLLLVAIVLFIVRIALSTSASEGFGTYRLVLVIILVLAVLAVFALYGMPKSTAPALNNTNPLVIQWHENNKESLDLNDYFKDPDNDVLTYTVSGDYPDNISVSIDNNIVKFVPDKNWFGNRRIRFIASDPDGETTRSSRITLEVLEVPKFGINELHSIYCGYINLILIILILIFLFFTPWKSLKKNKEGKIKRTRIKKEKGYHYYVDKEGDVAKRKR